MRRPRPPLFLARAVYRKRRLRDAARLLPLLGFFLLVLPMLWQPETAKGAGHDWTYVFVIWGLLIGLAAWLAPGLAQSDAEADPDAEDR
jgi:hypothetical protein